MAKAARMYARAADPLEYPPYKKKKKQKTAAGTATAELFYRATKDIKKMDLLNALFSTKDL